MSYRKGRVFALASLLAVACAMLSAGAAEAQCKGGKKGGATISSQGPIAAILRATQPYSTMNQQQLSTLSQRQLKALLQLQQKQMRALQRLQQQPAVLLALQQVQNQSDVATAALLQRQQQQQNQQVRALKVAGN